MKFIEAIIAYVDTKIDYELMAFDPGVGKYYSRDNERQRMKAAREQLLAFAESNELAILRMFHKRVSEAMKLERTPRSFYEQVCEAQIIAENSLALID